MIGVNMTSLSCSRGRWAVGPPSARSARSLLVFLRFLRVEPRVSIRGCAMTTWNGKVAVVTGAASGIGLAIARDLAGRGVRVTLSDIDEDAGQRAAGELPGARFQRADLARAEEGAALIAGTLAAEGRVDI